MNKKISAVFAAVLLLLLGWPGAFVHAVAPSVVSFTQSSSAAGYGSGINFSWSIQDGGGASMLFNCPPGVKVKTADGSTFSCGTAQSLGTAAVDSQYFNFINVTGSTKSMSATLIPKDSGGSNYTDAQMTVNFTVAAVPQPLTSFSVSSSSPQSGAAFTLTWTGVEIDGANLLLTCVPDLTYYGGTSTTSPVLPCGTPAFSTDLPGSGSQSILAVNRSTNYLETTARMIPAMTVGAYDATHPLLQTFVVGPKQADPVMSVSRFAVTHTGGPYDEAFSFSWAALNTSGVNLQFQCQSMMSLLAYQNGATSTLPCGTAAFSSALPAVGTTTVWFVNSSTQAQSFTVLVYPQTADSLYDGTKSKSTGVIIMPAGVPASGQTAPAPQTAAPTTQPVLAPAGNAGGTGAKVVHTLTFTQYLARGSRGAQVTALQQLLAQDPTLYPAGLVTGYFGAGTEAAVGAFQVRYGISQKGGAGYGTLGPKTRAKLNSLQTF